MMKKNFTKIASLSLLVLAMSSFALAADAPQAAPPPSSASDDNGAPTIGKRSKNLSFDNNVVEGMKKDPLDSLEHLAKNDGDPNGHLYRKRPHFKKEIKANGQEMGYSP
jgi:hypothetical protein